MEDSVIPGSDLEQGTTTNDQSAIENTNPAAEVVESTESKPLSVRDAVLKAFDKTKPGAPKAAVPELDGEAPAPAAPAKEIDPVTGRELEAIKPPGSMTPALREKWNGIPREMQKYWVDRERDMSTKLQETANERKLAQEFREVAAPYEAMLRQYGTTATAHAKELFNLSHSLTTGSPQQKAVIIDRMIRHYAPDMATLGQLANGKPIQPTSQAPQPNVQELVQKELAAREEARQQEEALTAVQAFAADPSNEFYDDVKGLMQKAIEAGFVDGKSLPDLFKNAYDFACNQHPEVKGIIASRNTVAAPVAAPVAQAAKPVASVKPSLGTGNRNGAGAPRPTNLRAAVEAAWDKNTR